MKAKYEDIRKRIKEEPKWFDSNGVPRYDKFHPKLCPNIYAEEVILMEIECQWCGKRFFVELHWDVSDKIFRNVKPLKECVKEKKEICYGDPPIHHCTGDTMTSDSIRIVEFWERDKKTLEWKRNKKFEIKFEENAKERDKK